MFHRVLARIALTHRRQACSNAPKDTIMPLISWKWMTGDAIIIKYLQPGAHSEKHILKFKDSVQHIRPMATELPEGFWDNKTEHTHPFTLSVRACTSLITELALYTNCDWHCSKSGAHSR
jgi:hypothetical protein